MSELNNQEVTVEVPLGTVIDMIKIIEVTATRGAYQASELQPVGTVYGVLNQLVAPYQVDDEEVDYKETDEEVEKGEI